MPYPFIHIKTPYPAFAISSPRADCAVHMTHLHDHGVAARFIEAVQLNPDEAWAFVSKMYAGGLDLNALREVLWPGVHSCKWVDKATGGNVPKHFTTRSLYVADPERDLRRLVHLRMVKEPDKNGLWKICAVEQEECPRGL
ncbi:MAG: hypothetical protein FWB88_10330 [Defluviitaleaceae bacterium]|nr:hypothetical protein [Defluviitaleaceae bacterium]MCL2204320.1 hypothetical protein [Defluviitaleaceae bacterium]MCL2240466.1 hypothetical protein [Defluviitaleaceae bacterium]